MNRGGRNWNHYRGRGGTGRNYGSGHASNDGGFEGRGRGRGRGGPPRGLRGKEIGLWYASHQSRNNAKRDLQQRPAVIFENSRDLSRTLNVLAENLGVKGQSENFSRPPSSKNVAWRRMSSYPNDGASASAFDDFADNSCLGAGEFLDDESDVATDEASEGEDTPQRDTPLAESSHVESEGNKEPDEADGFPWETDEHMALLSGIDDKKDEETRFVQNRLAKNPILDKELRIELQRREAADSVKDLLRFRETLPAYQVRQEFVELVEKHRVVVVSGLTGCGKSTQLPQALLDSQINNGDGSITYIVCTQPRRISAISLAERVAAERGESIKDAAKNRSVGYQIRLDAHLPRDQGSLLYCTTGIVLRWLTLDPSLSRVTHLFLDEIHERDLQSDLLLILVRDLLKERPDLRVILMSATLEARVFLNYFSKFEAPLFEIAGRSFPVQRYFLEDVIEQTRYRSDAKSRDRNSNLPIWKRAREKRNLEEEKRKRECLIRQLRAKKYSDGTADELQHWRDDDDKVDVQLVHRLTRHLCETDSGDTLGAILIFVPGMKEIKTILEIFTADTYFVPSRYLFLPLHSMIPTSDQQRVFARPPPGCRKIIVATNIAETSITIDDVVFVIDAGKIKLENFDQKLNWQTLRAEWVSKANAVQRQGRAGRCQPGVCYHLFPSWKYDELPDRQEPEMRRTRLTSLCLTIKALMKNAPTKDTAESYVLNFLAKAIDPPDEEAVKLALDDLYLMGALTSDENLTPLGWQLTKFPVDPHCGKMIVYSALFSCVDPVLTIVACLDYRAPFHQPIGEEKRVDECKRKLKWQADDVKSDYLMWVNAYNRWLTFDSDYASRRFAWDNFLSITTLQFIKKMKRQFAELLYSAGFISSANSTDSSFNKYSSSAKVIEAVVAAGLYPRVAFVFKQADHTKAASRGRRPNLRIKGNQRVKIHPMSINCDEMLFETRYLVYQVSVKTTAYFLHECAMVTPLALCLAAGTLQQATEVDGHPLIVLDEWIKFYTDKQSYEVVDNMRQMLHAFLENHTESPNASGNRISAGQENMVKLVCQALQRERLCFKNA